MQRPDKYTDPKTVNWAMKKQKEEEDLCHPSAVSPAGVSLAEGAAGPPGGGGAARRACGAAAAQSGPHKGCTCFG